MIGNFHDLNTLLELYLAVVVVCVFEKVNANACLPRFLWTPKPHEGCDSLVKPVTLKLLSSIGLIAPSLNPARAATSTRITTLGVTSTSPPNPKVAPFVGKLKFATAVVAGGKNSFARG